MLKNAILPLKTLFSGTLKMINQYLTVARPQAVCMGARVTRIPIFASDGSLCCLLHKSLIYEYMAKTAIEAAEANPPSVADYDHLTLSNVLDSEKDRVTIRETLAFVAPGSTIGEAKAAMQRIDGCQDVFITDRGDRQGKVIGWLTNGIITRAITSG